MHSAFTFIALLTPTLSLLLLLFAGGFAVTKVIQSLLRRQRALPSPVRILSASVFSKRAAVIQNWRTSSVRGSWAQSSMVYYVTFLGEHGERLEFPVPETAYLAFSSGDTGKLTIQGNQYLTFEPI